MKCIKEYHVNNAKGFTLIELLVVIAIIGILASITVPNVVKWLEKGKYAKAVSEIKNADTQLTAILAEVGKSKFKDFLKKSDVVNSPNSNLQSEFYDYVDSDLDGKFELSELFDNYAAIQSFYNKFFYELLRQGRDSEYIQSVVRNDVIAKLGTGYMEIGKDPWGNQYNFWMGPIRRGVMPLRSYTLLDGEIPDEDDFEPFVWTGGESGDLDNTRGEYNAEIPGQSKADNQSIKRALGEAGIDRQGTYGFDPDVTDLDNQFAFGRPASKNIPVYIWSSGSNLENDANMINQIIQGLVDTAFLGGGDDPNNWDGDSGWDGAPK